MTHFIIGGDGFLGRHLAAELVCAGERVVIVDLQAGSQGIYQHCEFRPVDVRHKDAVRSLPLTRHDVVHHLAARQYHGKVPQRNRDAYFQEVNVQGTANVLQHMLDRGCDKLVYFSTDMVYGLPQSLPVTTSHPQHPLGPYGESKRLSEEICREYVGRGLRITVFRPRLIIGPGRLGVLAKLFKLISAGLPVPLIGDGSNYYQMVSVHDCVTADLGAIRHGVPVAAFNLGSRDPPTVRDLLARLIDRAGSKSRLLSTPARLTKAALRALDALGVTLLHREQYEIADATYLLDTSDTERALDWRAVHRDEDMVFQAFEEYRTGIGSITQQPSDDRANGAPTARRSN